MSMICQSKETYYEVVDYGRLIAWFRDLKIFDSMSPDICDSHFPLTDQEGSAGVCAVQFRIVQVVHELQFEDLVTCLHNGGCRGATIREGLHFGMARPAIHQKQSLFIPGSWWRNVKIANALRFLPHLSSICGTRHVYLRQLDQTFSAGAFFLAVANE